jgi:amidase
MPLPPTPDSFDKVEKIPDFDDSLSWRCAAARRRTEIVTKIPDDYLVDNSLLCRTDQINLVQESGILTDRELSIINLTATELLRCIHNQEYTAVEVTTAFCKSAAIAHQAVSRHKSRGTSY